MTAAQKVFGFAATACCVFVLFGSWAPLHYHHVSFDEVWNQYLYAGTKRWISRSDVFANILLGVPFAYTLLAFLTSGRQSRSKRITATLLTIALASCLAIVVELGQGWFPGRVPSIRDSVAQVLGAAIGCLAWWISGNGITALLNRMLVADRVSARIQAAITIMAVGVLIWSILPGDVLTSPYDLARKWTRGRIELIPFSRSDGSIGESIYQWIASTCLAIPLGLWATQFFKFSLKRQPTLTEKALLAFGFGMLPEVLQIPIGGRVASATDALFGVIGAALGIWLGEMLWSDEKVAANSPTSKQMRKPTFWFLASAVFLVIVCLLSWYPFDFVTEPKQIRERLRYVASNPFSDYQGSNIKILFVFARLAVISGIFGGLAGIGTGLIQSQAARTITTCAVIFAAFAVSIGLELGQLFEPSHTAGGLGLLMRVIATVSGFALGLVACRGGGLLDSVQPK